MPMATKVCRVCGREYKACRSLKREAGVFRWQAVACCPECGEIYLQRLEEARAHPSEPAVEETEAEVLEPVAAPGYFAEVSEEPAEDEQNEYDI